jgi:hypothetical protein
VLHEPGGSWVVDEPSHHPHRRSQC